MAHSITANAFARAGRGRQACLLGLALTTLLGPSSFSASASPVHKPARSHGPYAGAARTSDPCAVAFPHQREITRRIRFGVENVYNEDLSRSLVCSGSFGAPAGIQLTTSAKCDLAAAVYGLSNPAASFIGTVDCAALSAASNGPASAATGAVCGYLADVLGTGVGLFAAGVTVNPGVGVAVWRGVTFFGSTAVCVGLVDGGAYSFGVKYETDHEVRVAKDIVQHGDCLRLRQQHVAGVSRLNWSAAPCPRGLATHDRSPFRSRPATPPPVISLSGAIGPVQLGYSTQAGVAAALGAPEAEAAGSMEAPNVGDYEALGYECSSRQARGLVPVGFQGAPFCRTIYYIDSATGILGGFYTSSRRFQTSRGTRVGMSSAAAESHEHRPALVGCLSGIIESRGGVTLYIGMRGGRIQKPRHEGEQYKLADARVDEISVEASADPVGNLFC